MTWKITPYESVGPVQLGQRRNEIRRQLGPGFTSFAKDVGETETDAYDELGIHLYYDDEDRLELVEAFEPASVSLKGIALLCREFEQVEHDLARQGYKGKPTDVGYRYNDAGIALTLQGSTIEGVAVFQKGYYEDV